MKIVAMLFAFQALIYCASAEELRIKLGNVTSLRGDLYVALFEQGNGFPSNSSGSFRDIVAPIDSGLIFIIDDLPAGEYAISLFHDRNRDGRLNTNFMGIPKEPFGFSNNPRILFGPPDFNDSKFTIEENEIKSIRVDLKTIL